MRDKKGPVNKRVDFLSNKLNKYSIRKFTVGTASILIGSLMYLGTQQEAEAAENNIENPTTLKDNVQSKEGYNFKDPMDKEEKQAGQGFKGYGTFVKTGADGTTAKVGTNIPTRGKADNSFQYADNSIDTTDGKFHGQLLNNLKLAYNEKSGIMRAEYAGKIWEANISDLGLDKSEAYNFLITSSQRQGTSQGVYANGWMRTDLNNSTFKLTPNLVNKTETKTVEIPFETKREFNPKLQPGEERVKQEGQPGSKTITTPITVNPLTGEKVGEGQPTEEITKQPVDKIV
ncbi:TPA: G5 domain-containing protein, partial [Staphylococcus aureus]